MKRKFAVILAVMTAILLLAGCSAEATDGAMAVSPENNSFYGWDAVPEESEDVLYDYDMEVEAPPKEAFTTSRRFPQRAPRRTYRKSPRITRESSSKTAH